MSQRYATHATNVATGTALKTHLQAVTDANTRAVITEIGVSFDGVSATAVPVLVELRRQTTAGTASAGTIVKVDAEGTSGATSQITFTAEPTAGDLIRAWKVSPTSGFAHVFPLGREPVMAISTRLAIVITAAATVNAWSYLEFEV